MDAAYAKQYFRRNDPVGLIADLESGRLHVGRVVMVRGGLVKVVWPDPNVRAGVVRWHDPTELEPIV